MSLFQRISGLLGGTRQGLVGVGDEAPPFSLMSSEGSMVSLAVLLAHGPVILAFYPRAFTSGCTQELRTYTRRHDEIVTRQAKLVAISVDDPATLAKFKASLGAPFPFLSDPDGQVAARYAGLVNGTSRRATVTIARDGRVLRITSGVPAIFPSGDIAACNQAG